jgi:hypothetical protein
MIHRESGIRIWKLDSRFRIHHHSIIHQHSIISFPIIHSLPLDVTIEFL